MPGPPRSQPIRWWPAVLILVVALLWIGWVWFGEGGVGNRQQSVQGTGTAILLSVPLLFIWLLGFSRMRARVRVAIVAGALGAVALFVAGFRYAGVSGDLVPRFVPRWKEVVEVAPGPPPASPAVDYPQFLGPSRDGRVGGVRLARDWSARPPRLVWRRPVGKGWSGFAVAGGIAVTQEQAGERERVVAYELDTGRIRWIVEDRAGYGHPVAGDGPRATPAVWSGRVYTLGATGMLNAIELDAGRRLWSRDVGVESGGWHPEWGRSSSPLVTGRLVVVSVGGTDDRSLVAYDADTGEVVWQGGTDRAAYSSPLVTTLAGTRQIVILNAASVAGHDPVDGHVLWSHPWPRPQPNITQPLPIPGDRLLVSAGYGVGSKLFQIEEDVNGGLVARVLWRSVRLKSKFANLILHEGYVYGLDDGVLACLDPEDGSRRWKEGRYGHGQLLLAGDLLLVQAEDGTIFLVEPDPDGPRELGSFVAVDGKLWNPPALAGSRLLVRNEEAAALFALPVE